MSRRNPVIDSLKGFGILCVVMGHVLQENFLAGLYLDYPSLNYTYLVIYAFHMPLFIIISGYLYRNTYFEPDGTVRKDRFHAQTCNLILLYVLHNTIFGVLRLCFSRVVNISMTPLDVLLFPIKPIGLLWYLYVLLVLYLMFYLLIRCKALKLYGGGSIVHTLSLILYSVFWP